MAEVVDRGRPPVASDPEVRDLAEAHIANGGDVILFDGVCNLCNASVLFVIDRDPRGHFAFAPLQSPEAARILSARGYTAAPPELASVLLVQGDRVYERSTAALRVARRLSGAWSLMSAFLIVPRPIRDAVYDWIARNRYRWFGRQDACRIPTPELRSRFVGGLSTAGQ
jgi:predicted DCC family thiol-disulfide oxidoreductase YuxK